MKISSTRFLLAIVIIAWSASLLIVRQIALNRYSPDRNTKSPPLMAPFTKYEQLRRRVETNIKEMWYYSESVLGYHPDLTELKNWLLTDLEELRKSDGYDDWRREELRALSEIVQKRLHHIQRPRHSCTAARKLYCRPKNGCGFGCELGRIVSCQVMAYATERTLIFAERGTWLSGRDDGSWRRYFLPLSSKCRWELMSRRHTRWLGSSYVWTMDARGRRDFERNHTFPSAIPNDLAHRLLRVHGDPAAWWLGQFVKYALRYQPRTKAIIEGAIKTLNFRSPIVGVQIRQTDKLIKEAAYHPLKEYMSHVKDYYDRLAMRPDGAGLLPGEKRRVFIATDEPELIDQAKANYPDYEIIAYPTAADLAHRRGWTHQYNNTALEGVIVDTYLLSRCDYLVCTFSSHMCRLPYEMMQARSVEDMSERYRSLDDAYYFDGQPVRVKEMVIGHYDDESRLTVSKGMLVKFKGNHWNGWSKVELPGSGAVVMVPSFKLRDKLLVDEFPTYEDVH